MSPVWESMERKEREGPRARMWSHSATSVQAGIGPCLWASDLQTNMERFGPGDH